MREEEVVTINADKSLQRFIVTIIIIISQRGSEKWELDVHTK